MKNVNYKKYFTKNKIDFHGKTVAITGSTGGIGRETAGFIAQKGGNLLLLDRNPKKSQLLSENIKKNNPEAKILSLQTDFSLTESIENSSKQLLEKKFDILILNTGMFNAPRKKGCLGFDQVFEVNFLIPFLFIQKIMPSLKTNKVKVVIVGSIAYKNVRLKENDLDYSNVQSNVKVYGNSKRFLMFALTKLFENEGIDFSICHPGIVQTSLTAHYHKSINWLVKGCMKILFHSPRKASLTTLYACTKPCKKVQWIAPSLNIWGKPKIKHFFYNELEAEKMLNIAKKLTEHHK